jgi:hypothetical protein
MKLGWYRSECKPEHPPTGDYQNLLFTQVLNMVTPVFLWNERRPWRWQQHDRAPGPVAAQQHGGPVAVERAADVAGRDACGRRHGSALQRDDEPTEAPR